MMTSRRAFLAGLAAAAAAPALAPLDAAIAAAAPVAKQNYYLSGWIKPGNSPWLFLEAIDDATFINLELWPRHLVAFEAAVGHEQRPAIHCDLTDLGGGRLDLLTFCHGDRTSWNGGPEESLALCDDLTLSTTWNDEGVNNGNES